MKNYDDLLKLLDMMNHTGGLNLDNESICDYQDMIGHSTEDQLTELCNGIYKESFYRVYDAAYGTIATLHFFCKHGEKIQAMLEENADLKCTVEEKDFLMKKSADDHAAHVTELNKNIRELTDENRKIKIELDELKKGSGDQAAEIVKLKARLYDMMEKCTDFSR